MQDEFIWIFLMPYSVRMRIIYSTCIFPIYIVHVCFLYIYYMYISLAINGEGYRTFTWKGPVVTNTNQSSL